MISDVYTERNPNVQTGKLRGGMKIRKRTIFKLNLKFPKAWTDFFLNFKLSLKIWSHLPKADAGSSQSVNTHEIPLPAFILRVYRLISVRPRAAELGI